MRHLIAAALVGACAAGVAWGAAAPKTQCVICHSYAVRRQWLNIVPQWRRSVHAAEGVSCNDCHGGNPRATDFNRAMYAVPGFKARWAKRDLPAMCARCHSNPAKMRPYNLPTHQYDQYKQSVHGRRLLEQGDNNVAVCTDCHGVHEIRAPNDPQSLVFKPNIPKLCARCHADQRLMAAYGLPGDEYEQYVGSVHGRKLLKEQDRAAPACPDCHGTHGATPPGVAEVPAVCGTCHGRTEQDFNAGAHKAALDAAGKPRCVNCHGDHGIKLPSDGMLVGQGPGHCGACHGRDSKQRAAGEAIYASIVGGTRRHVATTRLVNRAQDANMDVGELRAQLDKAFTALTEARALQHAVSAPQVQGKVAVATKIMDAVERSANATLADSRRRRDTVLAASLLFALGAVFLWLKRRQVMGGGAPPA